MHRRAATLFDQLTAEDPRRVRTIDRRSVDTHSALRLMRAWISQTVPTCLSSRGAWVCRPPPAATLPGDPAAVRESVI